MGVGTGLMRTGMHCKDVVTTKHSLGRVFIRFRSRLSLARGESHLRLSPSRTKLPQSAQSQGTGERFHKGHQTDTDFIRERRCDAK